MYPNDETGNVLADMADAGIDLSIKHNVVFFQLFEQKEQAQEMADFLSEKFPEMSIVVKADESPNVWDVDCTVTMVPDYDVVVAQEQEFERISAKFKGYNDGWGIEV